MATKVLTKHPDEVKAYGIDFEGKLAAGDSLTGTPTLTVSPSDLTLGAPTISGTQVVFQASDGTDRTMYVISVEVGTTLSNTLDGCVRLLVADCSAFVELLMMLRVTINDLDDENYSYTDTRLMEILCVAGKYVQEDVDLDNDYTINARNQTITPDPSDDVQFCSLVVLKAACLIDQGKYRNQALMEGIKAQLGPASMWIAGNAGAFKTLLDVGPCKTYTELRDTNNFDSFNIIRGVLSPFSSIHFDIGGGGYRPDYPVWYL